MHPKMIQVHGAPATIIMGVGEGGGWGRGRGGQELTHFFPIYVWGPLDMLDGAPLIFAHQARANLIGSKFVH